MTYITPKPLPDIPSSSVLRRLTTDSNALISAFIQRIVNEEGLDGSWIDVIKSSLVEFGEYVESGQILSGLKATRKSQSHARALADATMREHRRKERERLKDSKAGKGKGYDREKVVVAGAEEPATKTHIDVKLKEIHALTSFVSTSTSTDSLKHLFLTVSPPSETLLDADTEFDMIPASKACTFSAETFSFPFYNDDDGRHGEGGVVICGLDNWLPDCPEASLQIVGGTFSFRTLGPGTKFESLTTILKLSIYTYMSLILEQHLLSNFCITLQYPKAPSILRTSTPLTHSVTLSPSAPQKPRSTKPSSRIWSFLSKKTEGIIHRVTGTNLEDVDGALLRTTSIDLGSFLSSKPSQRTQRSTEERAGNTHEAPETESASNTIKTSRTCIAEEEVRQDREKFGPFASTVRRVQDQHCILSTSPKVIFPLPPLIVRLAQREVEQRGKHVSSSLESSFSSSMSSMTTPVQGSVHGAPNLRLTGVEKTGLGSILGWEGQEARGKGMAGIRSFVRHQGLVALYAEHTQLGEEMHPCGRPKWVTFRYWSRRPSVDADRDQTLGEFVERFCDATATEERCEKEGCDMPRSRHCMSWACGGVRVGATVKDNADIPTGGDDVWIWQTCAVCGQMTEKLKMVNGTYLFSFAKYLELLIWSPIISSLSLCEHITSPSPLSPQEGDPPLSGSRFHILRHFAQKRRILTFTLTPIHNNIYKLRLPKFQIISGSMPKEERNLSEARKKQEGEEERLALGTEINTWWLEIKTRLDKLEDLLETEAVEAMDSKDLPPLPTSDDEDSEDEAVPSRSHSPFPRVPPNSRSISFAHSAVGSLTPLPPELTKLDKPAAPYPPGLPISTRQSQNLLGQLRASFLNTENILRKQVQDTPVSSLNDVRRAFRSTARGISKRLAAWQMKHVPSAPVSILNDARRNEPEWWSVTCHTVPGGRVVVREGEWGSLIAFTLSSLDYQRELAKLNAVPALASSPALSVDSEFRSHSPNATIKAAKLAIKSPDPDENDTTSWEESEPWTTVISRREHPREVSSLLSLRDVLRTKPSSDSSSLGSRFSGSLSRGVPNFTPPSAWAQPQVQVNLQAAGGQVSQFPEAAEVAEKFLESRYHIQYSDTTSDSDYKSSALDSGDVTPTPSSFVEKHIRRGDSTIIHADNPAENDLGGEGFVPIMAPQPSTEIPVPVSLKQQDTHSSGSSFSDAVSNAMRYFLSSSSSSPSRGPSPVQQGPHHGLLTRDTISIDERPHIKYDWTIGNRLKFSCTVYYAKQFDVLRKRCGVDTIVIKSLERSENWTAIGGKSKSNFWKSSDNRFIIKTLVNAWNVADLQVLIELAPSYFRYIDSTANKASALAKLMGFYTIEVKNLETGSVQAKHDLLVMENLFYDQNVARSFDLKGIQSRRVKLTNHGTERRTLFDGEWIEGQHRAPLLIQSHSGHILREAIKADAEFLAKSNIMDYSLLLGVDEERHEISCGLVDTIGSYTFAKTLEYKAKQNLNSGKGKEVTVIPPAEYHTRFVNSIENYFLTCPDKWTKSSPYIDRTTANDLPSVV